MLNPWSTLTDGGLLLLSHGLFRSSLAVCKSRVESRAQCVSNGAENSTSTLAKNYWVYLGVRTCELFLCFVAIVRVRAIMLTSLFSLFYVTGEFHRFLHRGRAELFLSLITKAERWNKNITGIFMNQSELTWKSPVSKIGECFQRKLENLRNDYAFALVNVSESRTKRAWNSRTSVTKAMLINREQNFPNNELGRIVSQQTNCNSDATKRKHAYNSST